MEMSRGGKFERWYSAKLSEIVLESSLFKVPVQSVEELASFSNLPYLLHSISYMQVYGCCVLCVAF